MELLLQNEFSRLLKQFNTLTDDSPKPTEIIEGLAEIKAGAINNNKLTPRQVDAIAGRVDNYLKGQYYSRARNPETGKKAA